jgi:flagellar biogenesis protein FliO
MPIYSTDSNSEPHDPTMMDPTQIPTGDLGAAFVKMFLSLSVLVALLLISYWFLRRLVQNRIQKGANNAAIQLIEKKMISPKTTLYLIEVDQKRVLVAESQLEVKRIVELGSAESRDP